MANENESTNTSGDKNSSSLSFLQKLKDKAVANKRNYLTENYEEQHTAVKSLNCPNCGAGRDKNYNVRFCAYCNYEFLAHEHTDGIFLKPFDKNKKD